VGSINVGELQQSMSRFLQPSFHKHWSCCPSPPPSSQHLPTLHTHETTTPPPSCSFLPPCPLPNPIGGVCGQYRGGQEGHAGSSRQAHSCHTVCFTHLPPSCPWVLPPHHHQHTILHIHMTPMLTPLLLFPAPLPLLPLHTVSHRVNTCTNPRWCLWAGPKSARMSCRQQQTAVFPLRCACLPRPPTTHTHKHSYHLRLFPASAPPPTHIITLYTTPGGVCGQYRGGQEGDAGSSRQAHSCHT
jgi:hypothetical protein